MTDTPAPPEDTARPARPDRSADPRDPEARAAEREGLRRRRADLDNARKRCAAQITRVEAETRAAVAREWLPVLDNLDRALEHSSADPAAIIEGVRAVRDQALGVLGRLGFPRREDDEGAAFDPARHDAVAARDAAGAAGGSGVGGGPPGYCGG